MSVEIAQIINEPSKPPMDEQLQDLARQYAAGIFPAHTNPWQSEVACDPRELSELPPRQQITRVTQAYLELSGVTIEDEPERLLSISERSPLLLATNLALMTTLDLSAMPPETALRLFEGSGLQTYLYNSVRNEFTDMPEEEVWQFVDELHGKPESRTRANKESAAMEIVALLNPARRTLLATLNDEIIGEVRSAMGEAGARLLGHKREATHPWDVSEIMAHIHKEIRLGREALTANASLLATFGQGLSQAEIMEFLAAEPTTIAVAARQSVGARPEGTGAEISRQLKVDATQFSQAIRLQERTLDAMSRPDQLIALREIDAAAQDFIEQLSPEDFKVTRTDYLAYMEAMTEESGVRIHTRWYNR